MTAACDHDDASTFNVDGDGRVVRKEVIGELAIHRCNRFDAGFFKIRPARNFAESSDAFHQWNGVGRQKKLPSGFLHLGRPVPMGDADVAQAGPPGEMRPENRGMGDNRKILFPHSPDDLREVSRMIVMTMCQDHHINHLRTEAQSFHVVKEHFRRLTDVDKDIRDFVAPSDLEEVGGAMLCD
jgi:hypothetical protein